MITPSDSLRDEIRSSSGGVIELNSGMYTGESIYIRGKKFKKTNPLRIIAKDLGRATVSGEYRFPYGKFATSRMPNGERLPTDREFQSHFGPHKALGFVWNGLIHLKDCTNIHIEGINVENSRGGGLVIENCENVSFSGGYIKHSRHAAIRVINSRGVEIAPTEVHDNANFASVSRPTSQLDWPVIVNVTHGSQDVLVRDAWVRGNYGEGVGSGQGVKNVVYDNLTVGPNMSMGIYDHFGADVWWKNCIIYHDKSNKYNRGQFPSPLVAINAEYDNFKNEPQTGSHKITGCILIARSDAKAFSIWGNQGKGKSGPIEMFDNLAVSESGSVLHSIGNIAKNHTDTRIFDNHFIRLDGGNPYDDGNDGKAPISGDSVTFNSNMWHGMPVELLRSESDTYGLPRFANLVTAENIEVGSKPKREDYQIIMDEQPSIDSQIANLHDVIEYLESLKS